MSLALEHIEHRERRGARQRIAEKRRGVQRFALHCAATRR